jgi:hypothetical protein
MIAAKKATTNQSLVRSSDAATCQASVLMKRNVTSSSRSGRPRVTRRNSSVVRGTARSTAHTTSAATPVATSTATPTITATSSVTVATTDCPCARACAAGGSTRSSKITTTVVGVPFSAR